MKTASIQLSSGFIFQMIEVSGGTFTQELQAWVGAQSLVP